jgi:hypothetical protein
MLTDNVADIRAARGQAKEVKKAKKKKPEGGGLPKGCPVQALGLCDDIYYYLDANKQLRLLRAEKHGRLNLQALFGNHLNFAIKEWPKKSAEGHVKGVDWDKLAAALMSACADVGIWNVPDLVRGVGGWVNEDGKLVYHCGDAVYVDGELHDPCRIGRYVYPAAPPSPGPALKRAGTRPANELLELLNSWAWRRPDMDPALLLGWIGCSLIGGALDWRPMVWITGDKATGKSTLHKILRDVHGQGGIIQATDATAAGLWQTVGNASLPVALDELEAEEDNRKSKAVMNLARHASSGGQTVRGGSDHRHSSFTVRSCFLFSSILIPPMQGQDLSRLAILQLDALTGRKAPHLEPLRLAEIGSLLRTRIMERWSKLPELLHTWQCIAEDAGHGGRGADQFGTLLAMYWLLICDDDPEPEEQDAWIERLNKASMAESEEDIPDWRRCLDYLMSAQLDFYRSGERRTVGSWVLQAAGLKPGHDDDIAIKDAQRAIENIGLKVQDRVFAGGPPVKVIYIANSHNGLAQIFRDTHWAGRSGSSGVWAQAVKRVPQSDSSKQRFGGVNSRCTCLLLSDVIGGEDGE